MPFRTDRRSTFLVKTTTYPLFVAVFQVESFDQRWTCALSVIGASMVPREIGKSHGEIRENQDSESLDLPLPPMGATNPISF